MQLVATDQNLSPKNKAKAPRSITLTAPLSEAMRL